MILLIEYLYNAIRATAESDLNINAKITDGDGVDIVSGCYFQLFNDKEQIIEIEGIYNEADKEWYFEIPSNLIKGLIGRYWYTITNYENPLSFKQPIYLM